LSPTAGGNPAGIWQIDSTLSKRRDAGFRRCHGLLCIAQFHAAASRHTGWLIFHSWPATISRSPTFTALVTADFAAKAAGLPVADEHQAFKRWYKSISARPSMAAQQCRHWMRSVAIQSLYEQTKTPRRNKPTRPRVDLVRHRSN
jgi:hypothetical protein